MRRLAFVALAAGVLAAASFAVWFSGSAPVSAVPIVKDTHVHDNYYHPAGTFIVGMGTDHNLAQAACQAAVPDPECTTHIIIGDSVRWVAPAPLANNLHTVTECTDSTFTVCGAGVDPDNPIEDSGVLAQPGWPYQVQFDEQGVFYYRCEVHPNSMRGLVEVDFTSVGGIVDLPSSDGGAPQADSGSDGGIGWAVYVLAAAVSAALALGIGGLAVRRNLARRRIE
jgi:plastocyanin